MNWPATGTCVFAFVVGVVIASFAEYLAHCLMHHVRWLGKTHRRHHARGTAQGVLLEYVEYVWKSCWLMWPGFLISLPCGVGWLAGTNIYAVLAAFAHQLQHENPTKCFWMPMPVHFVHHAHNQWHENFGVAVDIWDRVFGTYRQVDWRDRVRPEQNQPDRPIWQLNWLWGGNTVDSSAATRQQVVNLNCEQQK